MFYLEVLAIFTTPFIVLPACVLYLYKRSQRAEARKQPAVGVGLAAATYRIDAKGRVSALRFPT